MYSEIVNIKSGQSQNIGVFIPSKLTNVHATVTNGTALLNGIESNFISWVNSNSSIIITAITDCTVEISDAELPKPDIPLP